MDVKKYRSKPIQAVRFDGSNGAELAEWIRAEHPEDGRAMFQSDRLYIATVEGTKIAMKGDFVVRGILGDFYPYPADVFEVKYEEIE